MTGKRKLVMALMTMLALTGGSSGQAASMDTLDEVIVTAEKGRVEAKTLPGGFEREETSFGLTGEQDIMTVPYTAQSISAKSIEMMAAPTGQIGQVLTNVPSIRTGTSLIKTDFSMRGMLANGSAMYLNNIPGFYIMCIGPVTNTIDRADVLVGPAATLSGSVQSYNGPDGGQPGSVYLYTKRAGEADFNHITLSNSGYGDWGEQFDISRAKLGSDGSWGVRVYGMHDKGGMSISGARREKNNISVDVSHETEKSKTNFYAGYVDERLNGTERRFAISRNSRWLPKAPDASKSYDDPNAMYSDWYGWQTTLNHEQKINDNLSWFLNAGMNDMTNRRMIYSSQINIDDMGNIILTDKNATGIWQQNLFLTNKYAQAGLKGKSNTGAVEHNWVMAVDRSYRVMDFTNKSNVTGIIKNMKNYVTGTPNIYNGIHFNTDGLKNISDSGRQFLYQEMDTSLNFMDTMKIGKWSILAAWNRRHGNYRGRKASSETVDNQYAPTYGISYQPNENLSIYGAYARATTRGTPISGGYDNDGNILDGVKVTQKELGVKYKWDKMYAAISYFDTNQPNSIEVPTATGKILTMDGENRYKGIDFNLTGQISEKWNVFGGFEYLNAKQQKTQDGLKDGLPTDSSAKWSAVLGLEYMPSADWSISGRMNYVGKGVINNNKNQQLDVPSSTVFDLFAKYKTSWGNVPVTLSAGCYNVFNRSYWALQPGQGNKLLLSSPRSFILSASFDF